MTKALTYSPLKYYSGIILPLLFCTFICLFYRNHHTIGSFLNPLYDSLKQPFPLHAILIYNLPAALWVFSMTLLGLNQRIFGFKLTYLPILFVLVLEVLQSMHLTDGTFDVLDMVLPLLFWFAAKLLLDLNRLSIRKIKITNLQLVLYPVLFLSVVLADTLP